MHFPLLLLCASISCINAIPVNTRQSDLKPITFDDLFPNYFYFGGFNGSWISDDEVLYRANGDLITYRISDGVVQLFLEADVYNNWISPSFTYSADYTQVLVRYNVTYIFRHSIVAQYDIYNIADKTITKIGGGALLNYCVLSPNSQLVAFVKENNVFVQILSGNEVQLTTNGINGVVYNGVPDWVYEEEVLGSGGALWFSPDGNKIAIASFDDTNVEEFTYILYEGQYEKEESLRYPKAGRDNPTVSFQYIDLTDESPAWHIFDAPVDKVTSDHILYSVNWIDDESVAAFWLNRRQNIGTYQICSTSGSRECYEAFEVSEPNGWVDITTPRCTPSGNYCFFIGFGSGQWRNIQRYNTASSDGIPDVMYPNNSTVLTLNGFSDDGNNVYYTSTLPGQPHTRHVFRNDECLTCGFVGPEEELCDYASASFSKSFTYFAFTCSGPRPAYARIYRTSDIPGKIFSGGTSQGGKSNLRCIYGSAVKLYRMKKVEMLTWQENTATRDVLAQYQRPQVHFEHVPVSDGFFAFVKLTLPPEIDLAAPTNIKYPMIVEVYGGPDSVEVTSSFSVGFKDYQVTSLKIIHCRIDGRGSGNKGKDLLFAINNKMGTVEIEDQITVTKYLQQKYQFIDETRTGIWGWSYGGYATAMVLSTDVEKVFQCGISVAPVSAWIYYDSIYTERYMGLPTLDDNLINYNATDVNLHIDELKSHAFLLMHGNADDNVHFQQSMVLTKALVAADVQFEQASYPNEAHSLGGVQRHVYHTIDQFWMKCFKLNV